MAPPAPTEYVTKIKEIKKNATRKSVSSLNVFQVNRRHWSMALHQSPSKSDQKYISAPNNYFTFSSPFVFQMNSNTMSGIQTLTSIRGSTSDQSDNDFSMVDEIIRIEIVHQSTTIEIYNNYPILCEPMHKVQQCQELLGNVSLLLWTCLGQKQTHFCSRYRKTLLHSLRKRYFQH